MSDLRTAAQQALEALEAMQSYAAAERKGLRICDEAIPALRAALAQQAEPLNLRDPAVQKRLATQWGYVPAAQAEPVEPVAWEASEDGRTIQDNDFTHDVVLRVVGDFENDEQRIRYAQRIVDKLNAALVAAAEREACAALLEANGMRCGEESLSRLILETNAAAIRARTP